MPIQDTVIRIAMVITMTELQSFLRLQAWLSLAFPTGAFAYSSGLEAAAHMGLVSENQEQLTDWLIDVTTSGQGWNDAVLLAESWRLAKGQDLSYQTLPNLQKR